jgi:hypothetical protein
MTGSVGHGEHCERARMWASLRLDGELSPFEGVLLDAHLAGCGDCRDFASGIDLVTQSLREVGRELPERPLTLPGRSRSAHGFLRPAVTAAAMAAALAVAIVPFRSPDPEPLLPVHSTFAGIAGNSDLAQLRSLSRAQQRPVVLLRTPRIHQLIT